MLSAIRHVRSAGFISTVLTGLAFPTLSYAALVISTDATSNVTCSGGVCSAMAANAVLNVGDVTSMLASAPLTIQSGSLAQDILIEAPFSWTSGNGLTLDSYRSIKVQKPISNAGPAPLTLTTNDGGSDGDLNFQKKGTVTFLSTENLLTINGQPYTLVNSVSSLASDIAANPTGAFALANSYDASVDGIYHTTPIPASLSGTVEGLGNAISRLYIRKGAGLFAFVDGGGTIRDLSLRSLIIRNYQVGGSGGLVGVNFGTLIRDHVDGLIHVTGSQYNLGGLTGWNNGTVSDSSADGKIYRAAKTAQIQVVWLVTTPAL